MASPNANDLLGGYRSGLDPPIASADKDSCDVHILFILFHQLVFIRHHPPLEWMLLRTVVSMSDVERQLLKILRQEKKNMFFSRVCWKLTTTTTTKKDTAKQMRWPKRAPYLCLNVTFNLCHFSDDRQNSKVTIAFRSQPSIECDTNCSLVGQILPD